MSKKPFSSIRILGKRHVVRWDQPIGGDCGLMEYKPLRISVGKGMAVDEERESLLHEALHAIDWQQNTKLKEKQVRQLSVGLYAMLRDNPKVVEYLLAKDDEHDAD
jgi:hypothetical protein